MDQNTTNQIKRLVKLANGSTHEPVTKEQDIAYENERNSAARMVCRLIEQHKAFGDVQAANDAVEVDGEEFLAQKEFWTKIVLMNGSPREFILTRLQRCSHCRGSLKVGDIGVYIPKTSYIFHVECWSRMKVRHTR
jgi:hypothetical protein